MTNNKFINTITSIFEKIAINRTRQALAFLSDNELEAMGITEDMWKNSKKIDFGKELSAAEAEAKAWKTIWSAGHGVSSIDDNPACRDLIDKLKAEFIDSIESQKANLNFSKNNY